ncbi:hypothetical protein [Clostridium saccharoperbutylacetonicum]|uniref:hypothetical protein n=1 Tax=Clostridium saccharoperbutylacetonicum TaxID=36745 RepID=UPI0039ED605B
MMLQVISKKFFKSDKYHKTEVKTIVYSNVNLYHKIETTIATLEPIESYNGITSYVLKFENVLEFQRDPGFQLVSVGQGEVIEDLLACFSFYFNGIFESDKSFIENLMRNEQQNVCDKSIPQKLLPEIFKRNIYIGEDKSEEFNNFMSNLIGLPNKKYMRVIASIKQVKDAIITINYNLELAYTMVVAAVEALATEFDSYDTQWEDCLTQKNRRKRLDSLLESIENCYVQEIKDIIIEDTHAKLGMRYRMFILNYISDRYYEENTSEIILKCKESQLERAIKNSYQLRSSYIHALESIPNIIKYSGNSEVYSSNGSEFFTFNGIIRITKFVIKEFIYSEEKIEKEDVDYLNKLPDTIEAVLASEYWIHKAENYSIDISKTYYQGLLEYISKGEYKEKGFILLENVCKKIEVVIKGLNNKEKKIILVDFYLLYNYLLREEDRCKNIKNFDEKYSELVEEPCIENAMLYIILGVKFPWSLDVINDIYCNYDKNRFHKNIISIPNKLEICYMLELANLAFSEGRIDIVNKIIIKAYRERANDKYLENIYYNLKNNNQFECVKWYEHYINS